MWSSNNCHHNDNSGALVTVVSTITPSPIHMKHPHCMVSILHVISSLLSTVADIWGCLIWTVQYDTIIQHTSGDDMGCIAYYSDAINWSTLRQMGGQRTWDMGIHPFTMTMGFGSKQRLLIQKTYSTCTYNYSIYIYIKVSTVSHVQHRVNTASSNNASLV